MCYNGTFPLSAPWVVVTGKWDREGIRGNRIGKRDYRIILRVGFKKIKGGGGRGKGSNYKEMKWECHFELKLMLITVWQKIGQVEVTFQCQLISTLKVLALT